MKTQSIAGSAGALQVVEDMPAGTPAAVAVICHPHPQHGGNLNNKVVHQLAKTFTALDAVCIRFNFRGVGESEGEYDEGRGELQDLLAVVAWAQGRWPELPLWLGGFSFGGFIALQGAQQLAPQRLVTVAPAVNYFPDSSLNLCGISWLLIQGDADDIVPAKLVEGWLAGQEVQPQLVLLEGAGHFFHGRLNDLKQAIVDSFSAD
ncbi:MAG: Dot/Icm type IV secretion system effector CoxH3 [Gammaproteobacteria bacterium]|nr:MAG: Dot/Icm type IV secretion system effector CoxH3 [Gammaproteobacteria bacterium]